MVVFLVNAYCEQLRVQLGSSLMALAVDVAVNGRVGGESHDPLTDVHADCYNLKQIPPLEPHGQAKSSSFLSESSTPDTGATAWLSQIRGFSAVRSSASLRSSPTTRSAD